MTMGGADRTECGHSIQRMICDMWYVIVLYVVATELDRHWKHELASGYRARCLVLRSSRGSGQGLGGSNKMQQQQQAEEVLASPRPT